MGWGEERLGSVPSDASMHLAHQLLPKVKNKINQIFMRDVS